MDVKNNTTAPEEAVACQIPERYEHYQKIADVLITQLQKYEIRYDEIAKLQACIKTNLWKKALHS